MNEPSITNDSVCVANDDIETLDYLRGVKSSTCLLLSTTPSPTPLDFKHPLSEEMSDGPFVSLNNDPNMVNIQTDASAGDSSSSGDSNSVVQDPVSAQLINNISMLDYQTLSKNGDLIIGQVDDSKINGNLGASKKLPNFVNWNWNIIRKVLLWIVCSCLVACLAAIIALVVTIPKECNPDLPWDQGKVFYEVFPASFKDSNNDGTGDLRGLIEKLDYIQDLGASAIRLNYIYQAHNYSKDFYNITSLIQIDTSIGDLKDFRDLVLQVHSRNMSLVLDLPIISLAKPVAPNSNFTDAILISNETVTSFVDPTTAALIFWEKEGVDGFYLKDLDNYVEDSSFGKTLQLWKQLIGSEKILIASENTIEKAKGDALNILLSRIDLIDVHLDLQEGITGLKNRIEIITDGILWRKPHYPWVHWNIGSIQNERVSSKNVNNSLAFTFLEFMLPGTVNIFYGDEIGLGVLPSEDTEIDGQNETHNTVQMSFTDVETSSDTMSSFNAKSDMEPQLDFLKVIKHLTQIRLDTPTIYLRSILKQEKYEINMKLRKTEENLVVIERWYPRRHTCVFVGNLGNKFINTDLSSMFYGGTVIAGTNSSLVGEVLYFNNVTFSPNSAVVLRLEK